MGARYATGVIVTQVVPAVEGYSSVGLEYKTALTASFPGEAPDYVSFEAYLSAKVLIEALKRAGPQLDTEKVVDTPFDFNTQIGYKTDIMVRAGDKVSTRCQYTNPNDTEATWGEKTTDEMCFNFISYYPKVETPIWHWALPSALAKCHPTIP